MINISIPGYKELHLENLVLDYNGTLACDGRLIAGVRPLLEILAVDLRIYVITADTFGSAQHHLKNQPCELTVLPEGEQDIAKRDFVRGLGSDSCVCVGNGRNDRLMLKEAALGMAVILDEGASGLTIQSADVVATSIVGALQLLTNPKRLIATLRS
ncbi:MAG: ATPase P [candidate division Zixibacteria bacterium]|nr:ATPase P [candidate division Zixibacteria bacterium]